MNSERFEEAFKYIRRVFNIEKLHENQKHALKEFYSGENIYISAPTGYGKSIIFQSLPLFFDIVKDELWGTSTMLVISPLKALMEDQCKFLKEKGISAIALHDQCENIETKMRDVMEGIYSLVYTSPERMLSKG